MTGAMTPMTDRTPSRRATAGPSAVSEIMARASTMPAAPPKPAAKRATARSVASGAMAHTTVAARHRTLPAMSGRRRPRASESGPITSCPIAIPRRKVVIVSWMALLVAPSSVTMAGNPGRYMSIDSGAMAVSAVRMLRAAKESGRVAARTTGVGAVKVMTGTSYLYMSRYI